MSECHSVTVTTVVSAIGKHKIYTKYIKIMEETLHLSHFTYIAFPKYKSLSIPTKAFV